MANIMTLALSASAKISEHKMSGKKDFGRGRYYYLIIEILLLLYYYNILFIKYIIFYYIILFIKYIIFLTTVSL